eukprot:5933912-Prymnesium_polylepis.2
MRPSKSISWIGTAPGGEKQGEPRNASRQWIDEDVQRVAAPASAGPGLAGGRPRPRRLRAAASLPQRGAEAVCTRAAGYPALCAGRAQPEDGPCGEPGARGGGRHAAPDHGAGHPGALRLCAVAHHGPRQL